MLHIDPEMGHRHFGPPPPIDLLLYRIALVLALAVVLILLVDCQVPLR